MATNPAATGTIDAVDDRPDASPIPWMTDEQAHAIFDAETRRVMGMSGADFLRRYDAGEFDDTPDDAERLGYWGLVVMIPLGQ